MGPNGIGKSTLLKIIGGILGVIIANVMFEEYREKLAELGIEVTEVVNHDDSETQASEEISPSTFVRSIYFKDPDGTQLEFAAWARPLTEADVVYPAADAANGASQR